MTAVPQNTINTITIELHPITGNYSLRWYDGEYYRSQITKSRFVTEQKVKQILQKW